MELAWKLKAAGDHAVLVTVNGAQHDFTRASSSPIEPSISELAVQATAFFVSTLG